MYRSRHPWRNLKRRKAHPTPQGRARPRSALSKSLPLPPPSATPSPFLSCTRTLGLDNALRNNNVSLSQHAAYLLCKQRRWHARTREKVQSCVKEIDQENTSWSVCTCVCVRVCMCVCVCVYVWVCCAQDLLTEGLIKSGHDVLRVERKNQTFFGNLNDDGTIDFSSTVVCISYVCAERFVHIVRLTLFFVQEQASGSCFISVTFSFFKLLLQGATFTQYLIYICTHTHTHTHTQTHTHTYLHISDVYVQSTSESGRFVQIRKRLYFHAILRWQHLAFPRLLPPEKGLNF